ncbi:archaemetzincin family Zn-dependent metalloprotease [Methanohalobium sp.]|uniref:archaemetzincin family Zn-dependent metalloprotease n=1 Tax=Methanohalobium sp. TaxID=2837493 RepID=UPI0025F73303|nr:archaemetzincin family Zn-dependent metalloprotease [Methanohalobium sp.]
MFLYLRPIGHIENTILSELIDPVNEAFGVLVKVDLPMDVPENAYNLDRGQYHSSTILEEMYETIPEDASHVLGITDIDLYVPQLNFVFGEASNKVAVISITRLRNEYYELPKDYELFKNRIIKEAIHEIGHMFGFKHCPNKECVMHFSNSLEDTDTKSYRLCSKCQALF